MKTTPYITILLAALTWCGCSNDDDKTLPPSGNDPDWFALEDSPDPTDHMRYEIYRDYDISVYYTDLLGTRDRGINGYGDQVVHSEMIDPFYTVTGNDARTKSYTLSTVPADIHNGVVLFRDKVLPDLKRWMYPRCVLLARELTFNTNQPANIYEASVYHGIRATVIGRLDEIGAMSDTERGAYAKEVLAAIWYSHAKTMFHGDLLAFFHVSDAIWIPGTIAGSNTAYFQLLSTTSTNYKPHWNALGFLVSSPRMKSQLYESTTAPGTYTMYYTPDQDEDAISFFQAVLTFTEAEFAAKYGSVAGYGLLLDKYRKISEIVAAMKAVV